MAKEPPFRLVSRALARRSSSTRRKALYDAVWRPSYLNGVLHAADEAIAEGATAISVLEFGVAGGDGLVALEEYAAAVEAETGVLIDVFAFDTGAGIPDPRGDYRDHPDRFRVGDFPMDPTKLEARLSKRTKLIFGDVADTVRNFQEEVQVHPIGFVSIDVDLYSSARAALQVLSGPSRNILRRVKMYFDDTIQVMMHRFAGELLAISEFNEENKDVKIDRWLLRDPPRPFPESPYLLQMYQAHDLEAIAKVRLRREPDHMDLGWHDRR